MPGAMESFKLKQNAPSLTAISPICFPPVFTSIPLEVLLTWALVVKIEADCMTAISSRIICAFLVFIFVREICVAGGWASG
jgi:hypothetical protein